MISPRLSIIVPCLDEGAVIERLLAQLQSLRGEGHEVVVVDGGSRDATRERAAPWVDRLLVCAPGRARQMNLGAQAAQGDMLWFLHADTRLPEGAAQAVIEALQQPAAVWGRFDVALSGVHPLLRMVEAMINLRSRLSGIATGDQGIFVRRQAFEAAGGFADIALMEDIALSRRLKRLARPRCLCQRLITSSRRWESRGILRTVLLMWWLRLAYALGASPAWLARRYRPCATPTPGS